MHVAEHTRNLRLVGAEEQFGRPWLLVHSIRTAFLVCILLVSVVYQINIGNFLNVEIWLPVYGILLANFFLNSIYLFLFDKLESQGYWNAALFALDTLAVTSLIYFTGTGQSLFLFLYLVNLILGGLVFTGEGAWLLTLWTSMCFSALLILSPEISGQGLYFSLAVNNIAFVAVTMLSGRLSAQLTFVGSRLKETHSDLLALQNLNELIVNNITTGIVVVSRTGFVQFFNPPASKLLRADHFQQVKIQDVVPELGWPWEGLIADESVAFERRELRLAREGGETLILEVVAARFRDVDGKLKGWLLLFDDRTDQKLMEETMRQQEKLAAVGQLAAGIAHEIRNPLASISGSIQLMMGNAGNHRDEDLKLMRIVDKEIDRLNGLISEFLEYVRPEQKVFVPVDLNAVVREVVESLQFNSKIRKDVEQKLELRAASQILGNRDKLKQAILNFVINAYQAVDKVPAPRIEIETHDQNDLVVLVLRDNGCG
ncbi:MAG TPA: histidine kinase dimerization/phospho-acceptor domain-containing protein, partial [Bdellovibrionales bacterium]|nr:histidine kinase dimerization/phospho-acceptor domain-containing protein [Bdellovibrionales bacterium]